jgi:hypothetical protein
MQPCNARHLCSHCLDRRIYCCAGFGGFVGDQSGQQRNHTQSAMGTGNSADRFDRRIIVEHNAIAAIDLQIHKTGAEDIAVQIYNVLFFGHLSVGENFTNPPLAKNNRVAV